MTATVATNVQTKPALVDSYGRRINYLRVSLIDHCNLRCVYCMPLHGLRFLPRQELLTPAEIETIVRAAVDVGFDKVRLTGGEPTLRPDLIEIVERLARIEGLRTIAMTTNGIRLPELAEPLKQAGLTRVNIHIDTLNPASLERLMRFNTLEKVWAGIEAAERAGLLPIKLNAVVIRGYNDEDVADLAALTLEHDWHVRFIEAMPLGTQANFALQHYVPNSEVQARIEERFGALEPLFDGRLLGEAKMYRIPGARGLIGFINPVSEPYCDDCNRMRLTADGKIRLCLLTDHELDFRRALHEGGMDALRDLFIRAVQAKPVGHQLRRGVFPQARGMSQIGG
ncbi:cyclic pyranopterin phosphate synthase [Ardenticatena maritima]|uniref:GTP 3',8-cyclase n=1 Tax=Ardenticatena maritima TaxID=872965 RepID=A0A0M9UDI6_9CHLR|nr:GTP 3',8-cyclase MoaA [Ardenticatena maritima]KPL86405.1 molybdenum cofactor biosynthesis protein MoeA [Ardenticatena maritima]GAP64068.1 cyclic pyranopterin phosphate synthase [Ardenticatena maritima]